MVWHRGSFADFPKDCFLTDSSAWLKSSLSVNDESVILVNNDAVWPFILKQKFGFRVLENMGADNRSSAGAIFKTDKNILKEISLSELPGKFDLIDLRRLPQGHQNFIVPELKDRNVSYDGVFYDLELMGSWDNYWQTLKKKFKSNIQNAKNRITRDYGEGAVVIKHFYATPKNWDTLVKYGRKVALNSWQGEQKVSVFFRPDRLNLLARLLENGVTQDVFVLFISGETACLRWTIRSDKDVLFYLIEYDERFRKYRVGHIITCHVLEYFSRMGYKRIDFGNGESPHKQDWMAHRNSLERCFVPVSLKGKAFVLYQQMRWQAGRFIKKLKGFN